MAATELIQLIITLLWACLVVAPSKNPLFDKYLFCQEVVAELVNAASLSFCPGLLDAVQAVAPPLLSWFEALPAISKGRWGVYILVIKKQSCTTLVYCGSATEAKQGIDSRWRSYDGYSTKGIYFDQLPARVKSAIDNGYTITHKGLLVWAPIPAGINVPKFRLLFVALEALFTFLFWTMEFKHKDYGMGSVCPWISLDGAQFEYDGACTHSSLHESVKGNFNLTAAEIQQLADERAANKKKYDEEYRLKNAAAIKVSHAVSEAKIMAEERYYCPPCSVACVSQWELDRHNGSGKHEERIKKFEAGLIAWNWYENKHVCTPCRWGTNNHPAFCNHKHTARHEKAVKDASASQTTLAPKSDSKVTKPAVKASKPVKKVSANQATLSFLPVVKK